MIVTALSGLIAGMVHVLAGPDHLAAVAPLAAGSGAGRWRAGFTWGGGSGFLDARLSAQGRRYPTVLQFVPVPAADRKR